MADYEIKVTVNLEGDVFIARLQGVSLVGVSSAGSGSKGRAIQRLWDNLATMNITYWDDYLDTFTEDKK
jgi:hypothetical protein